ncbi:MAG: thiolase [SAR202 cluster bacterium]|nr:thiolase [SAR202 cluster bacterium]|tara:strand:+ start:1920 stop:3095 length:1176 start_codon:yes stop_codon:yes gene_type:complete
MSEDFRDYSRKVAIVGAGESQIGITPHKNLMELGVEAALNALDDAGLSVKDVDGIFSAGPGGNPIGAVTEYLGMTPRYLDSTSVGGTSYIILVEHAVAALMAGLCEVAMIFHGEMARSRVGASVGGPRPSTYGGQLEEPFAPTGAVSQVGLSAVRHMHEYGTTREQMAEVAVSTRKWASLNPRAVMREPQTIDDVLSAPMVAWPFTMAMCCLVMDAGGCVILTTAERAKDLKQKPVYVAGSAESMTHENTSQMKDFAFWEACAKNAERIFPMAGVDRKDIDVAEIYDAFVYNPMLAIEALGFCERGESGQFVSNGGTAPGGHFPMNTHGGGLSYVHPGPYGIFPLIEGVRQMRGNLGDRQVPDAHHALVNGMGVGFMSVCGTLILSDQESV